MLTRSIEFDAFDPTIEEKIFGYGKRICVIFAVAAVTISTLDLMHVGAVETAAEFIRDSRIHYAELPSRILSGIREISVVPNSSSVTVAIPRDGNIPAPVIAALPERAARTVVAPAVRIAAAPPPAPIAPAAVKSGPSPVAELADARHADAIEFAMAAPTSLEAPQQVSLSLTTPAQAMFAPAQTATLQAALPAQAAAAPPQAEAFKLASISPRPGDFIDTADTMGPVATPVSLPMATTIPLDMVPLPIPAPGVPPPSPAQRLHLEGKEYDKAERCLANAVYWESRSEPIKGQEAVAQVVLNRVFSPFYPNDVCGVVYQNASRHLSCQFTFACDGKRKVINERGAWARANRIARQTLDGKIYVEAVAKSTHYHATYVHPYWTREMRKMVRFGIHNFYRPYAWGNGEDEPAWGHPMLASNKKK